MVFSSPMCNRFEPRKLDTGRERLPERQGMAVSAEFVAQITKSQRQLHAFILSMVWNPVEADDVLQETNLVLWE